MTRTEYRTARRELRSHYVGRYEFRRRFIGKPAFSPEFKARHERIRDLSRLCRWRRRSAEALAALAAAGADQDTIERARMALESGTVTPWRVLRMADHRLHGNPVVRPMPDEIDAASVSLVHARWSAQQRGVAA